MYGEGVSKQGEILDLAVEYNIVEKSGSWYSYNGEKMGQGRENAKLFLTYSSSPRIILLKGRNTSPPKILTAHRWRHYK